MAQIFSLLQVSPSSPISLIVSYLATSVPAGEHCLCVSLPASLFPSATLKTWKDLERSFLVRGCPPCSGRRGSCVVTIADPALLQSPAAASDPGIRCQSGARSSLGPRASLRDFTVPAQSPYHLFFNVCYNFGFQTSYKLGLCWLFTLFFRRLVRCFSWVYWQMGLAPTYLVTIFQPK